MKKGEVDFEDQLAKAVEQHAEVADDENNDYELSDFEDSCIESTQSLDTNLFLLSCRVEEVDGLALY